MAAARIGPVIGSAAENDADDDGERDRQEIASIA